MKYAPYSTISLLLSVICIGALVQINYDMAVCYLTTDGKGRALGIIYLIFAYKYYYLLMSIGAGIFAGIALKKHEKKLIIVSAFVGSVMSACLNFIDLWRLFLL